MATGKHLVRALAVSVGIALLVAVAAFAKPQIIRAGNVFLKDNGGISPSKLPKRTPVPISAHIDAEIGTTDGTHIPAVRSLNLDFDKSFILNAKGLSACRLGQLEARPTEAAKKACPGAIVGSGDGVVEVAFPEQAPFSARGPIVLFNGGVRNGTLSLFVHTYVSVPAPTAVVVPVRITRIHRGHFGIHAVAAVPTIAGGAGSVTQFRLKIGRQFTYRGKQQSFLSATCPTGIYYTEGKIEFAGGITLHGIHPLPCTPKG
jgi:hypothetical protein